MQPVPAGGYESAATGGGATTPHASSDADAPVRHMQLHQFYNNIS